LNSLSIIPYSFFQVLNLLSISEKSSKKSFSKNYGKFFLNFYIKNGAERHLGHTRGTHHATSPHGGVAQAWPRRGMVRGPLGPPLTSSPSLHSLSSKYLHTSAQTHVLAVLPCDFLISLLSPSLLLKFGAFVLQNGGECVPTLST
jgi:hypothetical protein